MMHRPFATLATATALGLLSAPTTAGTGPFAVAFDEVAPGVWTAIRPDGPRLPVMGNSTIMISDEGVVVFDGGGVPAIAEQILAHIRGITDAAVTHVVISHWHGDHNFGIYRFAEEYPEAEFVAHEFTAAALAGSPVDYIDGYPKFGDEAVPRMRRRVETGRYADGNEVDAVDRAYYELAIAHSDEIAAEFRRARVTLPTVTFDERMVIESGGRRIELLHLGHGNTAGDILMWLPEEKLIATGDLVVRPTPYAFNVPPRAWAATLAQLNQLGYEKLVPGHGEVLEDTGFVDLLIATARSIADQRDKLIAEGLPPESVEAELDFSDFEQRLTGGDPYITKFYQRWFEKPLRKAALKELTGQPMVEIGPRANPADSSDSQP